MKSLSCHRTPLSATLLLLAVLAAGCAGESDSSTQPSADSTAAATNPSPSAPTMPPVDSVDVAETPPDSATRARFQRTMRYARRQNLAERPVGKVIQALGTQFLGRPYIIGALDQTPNETLVCRLDGFDCFTFDEAVLAMARTVKGGSYSYDQYKDYTRQLRYRGGEMSYCGRLHYYTEFVRQAEQEGILRNITAELGGRQRPGFRYDFMTSNREAYPQLESDSLFQCIQAVERRLTRTMDYRYIPQDSIRAVYDQLRAGDLISTSTDIEGLDVTHTGLVYKGEGDSTGLLHASTSGGVKISPDLQKYVQSIDKQTGIIVARPTFGNASGGKSAN